MALAADEIVMDENAVLGPVDPQIGKYAAADILATIDMKPLSDLDDETLIMGQIARKAMRQIRDLIIRVTTANGMPLEKAELIADALGSGRFTHDYPVNYDMARELGLPVSTDMPEIIYELMDLYPQPTQRRPSVQYIPLPYRRDTGEKERS